MSDRDRDNMANPTSRAPSRACAILCNGPTLLDHDLSRITCPTIGLNRSWELTHSAHHIMIDPLQWGMYKRVTGNHIKDWPRGKLYVGKEGLPGAPNIVQLNIEESSAPQFSFDFFTRVYLCGTVTWVALQLAVHLGCDPIYFIGLDLTSRGSRGKFWGGEFHQFAEARQRELFGYARGLLSAHTLINVNEPNLTRTRAFPIAPFEEVFP